MKRYAVGYFNHYDNDLQVKVVEAADWKDALGKAFDHAKYVTSDDMEEAKDEAINQDWAFDAVEIEE